MAEDNRVEGECKKHTAEVQQKLISSLSGENWDQIIYLLRSISGHRVSLQYDFHTNEPGGSRKRRMDNLKPSGIPWFFCYGLLSIPIQSPGVPPEVPPEMALPLNSPTTFNPFLPLLTLHQFFGPHQTLWSLNVFLSSGPSEHWYGSPLFLILSIWKALPSFSPQAPIVCLFKNILSAYLQPSVVYSLGSGPGRKESHWGYTLMTPNHSLALHTAHQPYWVCL